MDYQEYKPPREISDLIECYWTNTLHSEDFNQDYDYIIPDGSTDAIFMLHGTYLRDDERRNHRHLVESCSLVPAFHEAVKVYQNPGTSCLVVRFKPGAVEQLSGLSLAELDQASYPLEEIMPELADFAMESVLQGKPAIAVIHGINQWILKRRKEKNQNHLIAHFLSETIASKGQLIIHDFCNGFGVHKSTLEKKFKHYTGLTPKQYASLIRFNYLIHNMLYSGSNLTETSHELGYFDQSHMIKDFKKVMGISPKEFLDKKFSVPKLAALSISNKRAHF